MNFDRIERYRPDIRANIYKENIIMTVTKENAKERILTMFNNCVPIAGSEGEKLLGRAGFDPSTYGKAGFNPEAPYYRVDDNGGVKVGGTYPAAVFKVLDKSFKPTSYVAMYFTGDMHEVQLGAFQQEGAAVWLRNMTSSGKVAVALTLDSALVWLQNNQDFDGGVLYPTNTLSYHQWQPPVGIKLVHVIGDCDDNYNGAWQAYCLANECRVRGVECVVHMPEKFTDSLKTFTQH